MLKKSLRRILRPENNLLDPGKKNEKKWWILYSLKKIKRKREDNFTKDIRNLFRLKKEIDSKVIRYISNIAIKNL